MRVLALALVFAALAQSAELRQVRVEAQAVPGLERTKGNWAAL